MQRNKKQIFLELYCFKCTKFLCTTTTTYVYLVKFLATNERRTTYSPLSSSYKNPYFFLRNHLFILRGLPNGYYRGFYPRVQLFFLIVVLSRKKMAIIKSDSNLFLVYIITIILKLNVQDFFTTRPFSFYHTSLSLSPNFCYLLWVIIDFCR